MKKNFKVFHIIFEICLSLLCLFIGKFEDLFILPMFVIATIYNIIYVLFLRRITGEKISASITNIILIWTCVINTIAVIYLTTIFFCGYTDYGLLGMADGTTYYGVDAWLNNLLVIVFGPFVIINFIYIGVYVWIKKKNGKTN